MRKMSETDWDPSEIDKLGSIWPGSANSLSNEWYILYICIIYV